MRDTILDAWDKSPNAGKTISSFGIGFAGNGMATLHIYKAGKLLKDEKKSVSIPLDKDVTTAVVAIEVMKSILDEETGKSFVTRHKKKKNGEQEDAKKTFN